MTPDEEITAEAEQYIDFVMSDEYAEMMGDCVHNNEAEQMTKNYQYRHHDAINTLGVFRWRGIYRNKERILEILDYPEKQILDFGGAACPLGLESVICDRQSRDSHGEEILFHNLNEFVAEEFDVVFSSHTLEHVPSFSKSIAHFCRILRPGGYMILNLPAWTCTRWRKGKALVAHGDYYHTFGVGVDCGFEGYIDLMKVEWPFEMEMIEYVGDNSILVIGKKPDDEGTD